MVQLEKILQQKLTRKQFLIMLALAAAGLFGIAAFLGALTQNAEPASRNPGYGRKIYGP